MHTTILFAPLVSQLELDFALECLNPYLLPSIGMQSLHIQPHTTRSPNTNKLMCGTPMYIKRTSVYSHLTNIHFLVSKKGKRWPSHCIHASCLLLSLQWSSHFLPKLPLRSTNSMWVAKILYNYMAHICLFALICFISLHDSGCSEECA